MPRKCYTVTENAKQPNDRILKFCIFTNILSFIVCVMLIITTIICMKNNRLLVTSDTPTSKEISSTNPNSTPDYNQEEDTRENHDLFEVDAKEGNHSTETHQYFVSISDSQTPTSESVDSSKQIFGSYDDFETEGVEIGLNFTHSTPTLETSTYSEGNQTTELLELNSTSTNSFLDLPSLVSRIWYESRKNESNFTSSFELSTPVANTVDSEFANSNETFYFPDLVTTVESFSEPERNNKKENLTELSEETTISAFASTLRRRIFGKAWNPVTPESNPNQKMTTETSVGIQGESEKNQVNETIVVGKTTTESSEFLGGFQEDTGISGLGVDN